MNDEDRALMCEKFCSFFSEKVSRIRRPTAAAAAVANNCTVPADKQHNGVVITSFDDVSVSEVLKLIAQLPNKSSPRDILPTTLLKQCAAVFAPTIAHLANISFKDGVFPSVFKTAQVLLLLKKPGLDRLEPANYRPISNLNTISKAVA